MRFNEVSGIIGKIYGTLDLASVIIYTRIMLENKSLAKDYSSLVIVSMSLKNYTSTIETTFGSN